MKKAKRTIKQKALNFFGIKASKDNVTAPKVTKADRKDVKKKEVIDAGRRRSGWSNSHDASGLPGNLKRAGMYFKRFNWVTPLGGKGNSAMVSK